MTLTYMYHVSKVDICSGIRVIPCQVTQKAILNPTLLEFNEIWLTCWLQPPNLKSEIFQ